MYIFFFFYKIRTCRERIANNVGILYHTRYPTRARNIGRDIDFRRRDIAALNKSTNYSLHFDRPCYFRTGLLPVHILNQSSIRAVKTIRRTVTDIAPISSLYAFNFLQKLPSNVIAHLKFQPSNTENNRRLFNGSKKIRTVCSFYTHVTKTIFEMHETIERF